MTDKTFAIVGGGIGGLTLAIALQRKGFNVTVYENAPQLKAIGAGLTLAGNAVKALMDIGICEEVLRAGKVMKAVYIKDDKGNTLVETDSEKLSAKLGTINNKGCVDLEQDRTGITLTFNDGTQAHANYLIACDGIHSVVRKKLLPHSTPRYAGYTCWRAVIDNIPNGLNMDETSETWGQGSRFGIAPLADNRLYWFACINAPANDPLIRSFTTDALLVYFKNYHSPVPEIIKKTKNEQLIWGDIIDLKPLHKFAFGNIVLMGDAAHATTPNMGQGACMAIEDAAVLSNCLEQYETAEEAFLSFEHKRIERTTKIVNTSRILGRIAQWENPILTKFRNTLVKLTPPRITEKQVRFITDVSFL